MTKEEKEKNKLFKSLIKDFKLAIVTGNLKLVEMAKENLLLFLNEKKRNKNRVEKEKVFDLLFSCYPPDMENFSTMTHSQAYRLLEDFSRKLKNYE